MESPITAMKQAFEDEEVLVLEESNHTDQNGSATLLALSEYERERGKPIPTFNHGSIQANLIIALAHTKRLYRVGSEVTIALGRPSGNP